MAKKIKRAAESWRYILRDDRPLPLEEQSVFVLRPLNTIERASVQDNLVQYHTPVEGGRTTAPRDHRLSVEMCLTNIESVENFPAGEPEPWPEGKSARLTYLNSLDDALIQELGAEIWVHSYIGDDVKNSSPPRPTSVSDGALAASSSTTVESAERIPG